MEEEFRIQNSEEKKRREGNEEENRKSVKIPDSCLRRNDKLSAEMTN